MCVFKFNNFNSNRILPDRLDVFMRINDLKTFYARLINCLYRKITERRKSTAKSFSFYCKSYTGNSLENKKKNNAAGL